MREKRREEVRKLGRKMRLSAGKDEGRSREIGGGRMLLSAGKEEGKSREIGEEDVTECGNGGGKK